MNEIRISGNYQVIRGKISRMRIRISGNYQVIRGKISRMR